MERNVSPTTLKTKKNKRLIIIPSIIVFLLFIPLLAMQFSSVKKFIGPGLIIATIKFMLVPALIVSLGYGFGLDQIDNGLPLKVVLILSSMPVGFIAMVPPTLYRLDIDMANACWLITNAALAIEIPILLVLTRWL